MKQLFAVAFSGLFAACASAPPPTEQMALARSAIEDAQGAGAPESAPRELNAARVRLDEARRAGEANDNDVARRLAEEAEADAKLAAAKARSTRATAAVTAVQDSLRTLREELDRASRAP